MYTYLKMLTCEAKWEESSPGTQGLQGPAQANKNSSRRIRTVRALVHVYPTALPCCLEIPICLLCSTKAWFA